MKSIIQSLGAHVCPTHWTLHSFSLTQRNWTLYTLLWYLPMISITASILPTILISILLVIISLCSHLHLKSIYTFKFSHFISLRPKQTRSVHVIFLYFHPYKSVYNLAEKVQVSRQHILKKTTYPSRLNNTHPFQLLYSPATLCAKGRLTSHFYGPAGW